MEAPVAAEFNGQICHRKGLQRKEEGSATSALLSLSPRRKHGSIQSALGGAQVGFRLHYQAASPDWRFHGSQLGLLIAWRTNRREAPRLRVCLRRNSAVTVAAPHYRSVDF